ncbi:MAG: lamin tail domain-containing protein, partial [Dehalococcoidia bacterium]
MANGGFEDGTTNGWTSGGGGLGVSDVAYGGSWSAVFSVDAGRSMGTVQHEAVLVQGNATYVLSAAILDNDPRVSRVRLRIDWQDSSGNPTGEISSKYADLTDSGPGWQSLLIPAIEAPADAVWAKVAIHVETDGTGGEINIDDVGLTGPPAPTSTPIPADTATPPPSSTVVPSATNTEAPGQTPAPSATATEVPTATPMASGCVLNGGFEEASGGVLVGWEGYGGTLQQTATHRRSGSFAAAYISNSDSTKWVYQAIRLQGDQTLLFDGYVLLDDPNVSQVFLRVSWYTSDDASGTAFATTDSTERLSGDDPSFRYLTTGAMLVPLGTHSAKVKAMLVPMSSARATIYLDDMSLREAPPDPLTTPVAPVAAAPGDEPAAQDSPDSGQPATARAQPPGKRTAVTSAPGQSPYQVKINELLYDPILPIEDNAYEWLELYNAGAEAVDVGGWTVSDNQSADSLPSTVLQPQGFAVVAASDKFRQAAPSDGGSLVALADGKI